MKAVLKDKLWAYMVNNNPDLLFELQRNQTVSNYLEVKMLGVLPVANQMISSGEPPYVVEEYCLNLMTEDLKPSMYIYVRSVLEEEFSADYEKFVKTGILVYEVLNILEGCRAVFEELQFGRDNEDDRHIHYAIIAEIHQYLN